MRDDRPTATAPIRETVQVRGLGVTFRRNRLLGSAAEVRALEGVDLDLDPGEVLGVLGPNGSGKTTLFRVLTGELRPTAGQVRVLGLAPDSRALTTRVGYQPEGPLPFENLTGRRFLDHMAALAGLPRDLARPARELWLERLGLARAADRPLRDYSTGMRKRLALASALLGDPALLVLDEPTAGLDPEGSETVLEVLRERAAGGGSVLVASHHLQEVEQACDRVLVLQGGRILRTGSLEDLLDNDERTLVLRHSDQLQRNSIEAFARSSGAEVVGWRRGQRHLFALFRELANPGASGSERAVPESDPERNDGAQDRP